MSGYRCRCCRGFCHAAILAKLRAGAYAKLTQVMGEVDGAVSAAIKAYQACPEAGRRKSLSAAKDLFVNGACVRAPYVPTAPCFMRHMFAGSLPAATVGLLRGGP